MDFSNIVLLPTERRALRHLRRRGSIAIDHDVGRALHSMRLAEMPYSGSGMERSYDGRFAISDFGRRYLESIDQKRRDFWKEHVVKFGFGFLTGVATGVLLSWLSGILKLPVQ